MSKKPERTAIEPRPEGRRSEVKIFSFMSNSVFGSKGGEGGRTGKRRGGCSACYKKAAQMVLRRFDVNHTAGGA